MEYARRCEDGKFNGRRKAILNTEPEWATKRRERWIRER
jgi:hypothetical protein